MTADYPRLKKELIPPVLLGASAVFAVLIVLKTTGFLAASARAEGLVRRAVGQNGSDDREIQGAVVRSCAVADELKKANLFSSPEPKPHPVTSVEGILGDEVLIEGKWYKAGDLVQDARIVAVEPTQVRIEWDGRERIFAPLDGPEQSDSAGPRRSSRSPRLLARANSSSGRPPKVVRTERAGASGKVPRAQNDDKPRQKVEKQRLAIEKKELQRASKGDVKKPQPDKKKKDSEKISKPKDGTVEKRAKKLVRK